MFQVPYFTLGNYQALMANSYDQLDTSQWREFSDVLKFLYDYGGLAQYQTLPANRLSATHPIVLQQAKLLLPTLWNCQYFSWETGKGTHHGVDIILPMGTPILSFSEGTVTKVKERDGVTKNEGNSITIKSSDCFWSYEHCERVDIQVGQHITIGQQIGTVWSTGNSTQYHIHLQCDNLDSPFQPYRAGEDMHLLQQYTLDPLPKLHALFGQVGLFYDMPSNEVYRKSITELYKKGIIHGYQWYIRPLDFLERYEFALLIYRLLQTSSDLTHWLTIDLVETVNYVDIENYDEEVHQALLFLYRYGVMKGYGGNFFPSKNIKWQEVLAVLGRIFRWLQDAMSGHWYSPYVNAFEQKGFISPNWEFIGMPIVRQEVFRLINLMIA